MKKLSFFSALASCFLVVGLAACNHHGNVEIKVSEDENIYKMTSYFDVNKTHNVQQYMNDRLGKKNHFSFSNTEMDANLTLENNTTFYIKSAPGKLEIKMDKEQNSGQGIAEVKEMCEGLKHVLAK